MQGDGAIGDVVQSFNEFNQLNDNLKPDVLVLIRGGGSLEDLSAFNSEEVARAVYGSKIPVVCGVGHERDESLADLTADMRASTPSNAAEIVVPDKKDFMVQLEFMLENLAGSLEHRISQTRRQVEQNSYLLSTQFETPLNNSRLLIDKFSGLIVNLEHSFLSKKEFVLSGERLFNSVNPKRVLKMGYSIARNKKGQILRQANQVDVGDKIVVELKEGKIVAEVKNV